MKKPEKARVHEIVARFSEFEGRPLSDMLTEMNQQAVRLVGMALLEPHMLTVRNIEPFGVEYEYGLACDIREELSEAAFQAEIAKYEAATAKRKNERLLSIEKELDRLTKKRNTILSGDEDA